MKLTNGLAPCVFVIFGATGDLASRKLFPALFNLLAEGLLPESFAVIGLGRRLENQAAFAEMVEDSIARFSRRRDPQLIGRFQKMLHYLRADFADAEAFRELQRLMTRLDATLGTAGNRIFFLSVGPEQFGLITDQLRSHRMVRNDGRSWQRVMVEKPFGRDLVTARALNEKISSLFREDSIFRIDHYLGKEMLQNLVAIRFANSLFEPLWNNRFIDNVQISVAETGGVGNRARYYETAGALRDVVQNHLLQMLALTAMEAPVELSPQAIRDEKVKVLRAIKPMDSSSEVMRNVVRGQYAGGEINGKPVVAYREEENVAPASDAETFVALRLFVQNFRWAGVPFYLRTGKRLWRRSAEVVIEFKSMPGVLYFASETPLQPNLLIIKVQPEEGVALQFNVKEMGTKGGIVPVQMDFCQNCLFPNQSPEAYERLIADVIRGDTTLFTGWDEVEHQWRFIDSIAEAWQGVSSGFPNYRAGTWGPKEAEELLRRDGRQWHLLE
jgi:glucose-6-phosphate 1-dehydrogenase